MNTQRPGLFGLENSNKDFEDPKSWGKNQFNLAFPTALACYMGAKNIEPIYLTLDRSKSVQQKTISIEEVFGLKALSPDLYFTFESQFGSYAPIVVDRFDGIDLVTLDNSSVQAKPLRDIEIKLTVMPDHVTGTRPKKEQGAELVVRPQTIYYIAMRLAMLYVDERKSLQGVLNKVCKDVSDWTEPESVRPKLSEFVEALDKILIDKLPHQQPFVMQPVWRTEGVSTTLNKNCFDIFIWSEMAFTRLFVDSALSSSPNTVTRPARTVIWLIKMLQEFASKGKFNPSRIKDTITLGTGNDKAFAVNGAVTNPYITCNELVKPRIMRDAVCEIILGGGEKYLSPERRLDAAILMTPGLF